MIISLPHNITIQTHYAHSPTRCKLQSCSLCFTRCNQRGLSNRANAHPLPKTYTRTYASPKPHTDMHTHTTAPPQRNRRSVLRQRRCTPTKVFVHSREPLQLAIAWRLQNCVVPRSPLRLRHCCQG